MILRHLSIAAALIAFCSGCASNNLSAPIGEFARVTNEAVKSVTTQQNALVIATQDQIADTAATDDAPIVVAYDNDCDRRAERCRLRAFVGDSVWPYSNGAFDDAVGDLVGQIVAYANNLAAIAGAGTPAEIAAATSAVRANTLALAASIDSLRQQQGVTDSLQASIAPYAAPVAELVTFGLQQLVEAKRRSALRAATHSMEPVLHEAVLVFNEIAEEGVRLKLIALDAAYRSTRQAYQADPKNRSKLAAYKAAADRFDDGLRTPADVFTKLEEAHTALTRALDRRDTSFQDLWPLLQSVAESATKLASIAQQIDAAANQH